MSTRTHRTASIGRRHSRMPKHTRMCARPPALLTVCHATSPYHVLTSTLAGEAMAAGPPHRACRTPIKQSELDGTRAGRDGPSSATNATEARRLGGASTTRIAGRFGALRAQRRGAGCSEPTVPDDQADFGFLRYGLNLPPQRKQCPYAACSRAVPQPVPRPNPLTHTAT